MADTTIVNLPALGETPAVDDLIEMVDISDTGNNATGENKKMTVAELVAAAGGGRVLLETITNATAGEFDFASIDQSYSRLIIKGTIRSDVSGVNDAVYCYLNTDTTDANYHRQNDTGDNGVANNAEGAQPQIGICAGSTAPAGSYSAFTVEIEDYAGSNLQTAFSQFSAYTASDDIFMGHMALISAISDPITRIRIQTDNHATDQLFGTLRLYGEM